MNFLPALAVFGLLVSPLGSLLAHDSSQHDRNAGAVADFAIADEELNQIYAKVLGVLDDESKEKLKKAQRAWVAYRDAEAGFSADAEARGGSLWPLIHEGTRARLTKERVKRLKELLIEEGE